MAILNRNGGAGVGGGNETGSANDIGGTPPTTCGDITSCDSTIIPNAKGDGGYASEITIRNLLSFVSLLDFADGGNGSQEINKSAKCVSMYNRYSVPWQHAGRTKLPLSAR